MKPTYEEMKALILKAMANPENRNGEYLNWDFIDADVYAEVGDRFATGIAYQRRFNVSVEKVLDEIWG